MASSASYLGLSTLDVAGPTAAAGPGGNKNLHIQLSIPLNGGSFVTLNSVNIAGPSGYQWTFGTTAKAVGNPQANPVIAVASGVVASGASNETFDAYFSPVVASVDGTSGATSYNTLANGQRLAITIAYTTSGGSSVTESASSNSALAVTPQDLSPSMSDAAPAVQAVTVGKYSGSFQGQTSDGMAHVQISGLPAAITTSSAELSDVAGINWLVGSTYGRAELGMTVTQPQGSSTADFAFPPERDEAGNAMTVRYQVSGQWYVTDVPLGASQHTDPTLLYGGPVDPTTQPLVVSATSSTNMVSYTDSSGKSQTQDFQQVLNLGYKVITLNPGTYALSEILTISSPMILQGANSNVTLNFTGLPSQIPHGVINLNASHITLNQFKVRFQDSTVNFTSGNRAIISDEENQPWARVDLNVKNLDIVAPAETSPFYDGDNKEYITVPTTFFAENDSGTIQNNVIYGGSINVRNGPWLISGNQVLGAVKGTSNQGAIAALGGHDITLLNNTVTDADPTNHGLINRFFSANRSGYGFTLKGNQVSTNVGLIAPVVDGSPSSSQNPKNEPEVILFEDYSKIFEGSVAAVGASTSSTAADNRRVISIPTKEFALFSGLPDYLMPNGAAVIRTTSWALTVLDGANSGKHIRVIQAFPEATDPNNIDLLLDQPLPAGSYNFDISPAFINVNITGDSPATGNSIDTSGTTSVGLVFASTTVDATVSNNTFKGDRSSQVDGNHNTLQSQAIRIDPNKANLAGNYLRVTTGGVHYDSYNVIQATITGNTFINAISGVTAYVEVDGSISTTAGRTYGLVSLTGNKFQYSYANPNIITVGVPGNYAKPINNQGVMYDPGATNFTDPRTVVLNASGNTIQWGSGVTPPASDTSVTGATVNGTLYGAKTSVSLLTAASTTGATQVSLGSVYNTVGITSDANPSASSSGLDNSGNTYSATALGSTGGTVTWQGQSFAIGGAGVNDVDSLGGTAITLPSGQYDTMLMLGSSIYGAHDATFIVHYSDGSTKSFTQTFSDWAGGPGGAGTTAPGESVAVAMSYYNSASGKQTGSRYVYGYSFALDPSKTVSYMEVTNNANLKLLAVDLVRV